MCAVVLINQVTTKISDKGTTSFLAPALGETWAHACTSRVMLYWDQGQRFASLWKSPSRKKDTVAYCVTKDGVSVFVSADASKFSFLFVRCMAPVIFIDTHFGEQIRGLPKKRSRKQSSQAHSHG